jgi:hypothetical protein
MQTVGERSRRDEGGSGMSRAFAPVVLLAGLMAACSGGNPPPPVSGSARPAESDLRAVSTREGVGGPADPDDPAEPGIGDLPRLARYVFRVMGRHEEVCPFSNPLPDTLHFALEVDVRAGRMTRVVLGHVGVEQGAAVRTLERNEWPSGLVTYLACLEPHLEALPMDPSPADGTYEAAYSFPGLPGGSPTP